MGSDRCTRTTLFARCCNGAFFGFGFALTIITLAAMFLIAWCYFGLTIVHISDTQRRAIVNYSFTSSTSKPLPEPSSTTSLPTRSTTLAPEETSINSIPKSTVEGSSVSRGSSRDASSSVLQSPRGPSRDKDEPPPVSREKAASILTASSENSEEDQVYPRRVSAPGAENRPEDKGEPLGNRRRNSPESEPRLDIAPTKVYDADKTSESSRVEPPPERPIRDDDRPPPRDYINRDRPDVTRRDDIQSSRRADREPIPVYREPDFDRDYPRRYDTDRGRSRYDDDDIARERGSSRDRYDTRRDRGRDSDDRYSKGDKRVYPDEDDRYYRTRERYPDDLPARRGDDDERHRDYEDRPSRNRDRGATRSRDRDVEDGLRDDRYRLRDDDRYRPRDEDRYRPRDDDRYRPRDEDRYRPRDDERIRSRDDDRYVYRDDDRYRPRGDDDRYRSRDDDRYPEDRRDTAPLKPKDDRDEYSRPRVVVDDPKYVDSPTSRFRDTEYKESASRGGSSSAVPAAVDRKPITSSRSEYDVRGDGVVTDYDKPTRDRSRSYVREEVNPSRLSRPTYDDVRDRDRDDSYRRPPPRYNDDDVRDISPTKTREDGGSYSRSSLIDSRPRDVLVSGSRYVDSERDKVKDDRYFERDDRIRSTRVQDSRGSESSRRVPDADDERYRMRLPNEGSNRREEVVLDRRSYSSEEDEEYRRRNSDEDRGRDRRPLDDTRRRYRDDEIYPPRRRDPLDDEDYKRSRTRDDYDRDRVRSRDRYDDEYRRYDDERHLPSKGDKSPPVRSRFDEDERPTRRGDSEMRKEDPRDREEIMRPSSSPRDDERLYDRDDYPDPKSSSSSSRRRYGDDDLSRDDYSDDRRYSRQPPVSAKDYALGSSRTTSISSREPGDVVIREKRYQSSSNSHQSSRVYADDSEKSREQPVRPMNAKDVIEAAIRHSDSSDQNPKKVFYPVFDPRVSNLTSPELIRPSERRGTTITAKKRRSLAMGLVNL